MPSDISLLILLGAALAGGVITWFLVRRRLPADAVAMIAQMAAEVRAVLGDAYTEADVRTLAGWIYDSMTRGTSRYYTKEQFIDLVVRAVMGSKATTPLIRASVYPNLYTSDASK